jgi:hypothetical protein
MLTLVQEDYILPGVRDEGKGSNGEAGGMGSDRSSSWDEEQKVEDREGGRSEVDEMIFRDAFP